VTAEPSAALLPASAVGAEALERSLREQPPRRILLMARSHIGDLVMTTGAIASIAARFPAAHITLETSARAVGVVDHFPGVADRRLRREFIIGEFASVLWLRRSRFDLAVALDDSNARVTIATRGGVPRIVGVRRTDTDPRFLASVRWNPEGHDLFDSLRGVVALLGADADLRPRLYPGEDDRRDAARALAGIKDRRGPLVGLFVDAGEETKRWPPERFVALAGRLTKAGCRVAAFAGLDGDARLAPLEAAGVTTVDPLSRPLALGEFIRGLTVLVTNDSAPAHLADAVGTPAVIIYGPTSPQRFAPYGQGHRLLHAGLGCDFYLKRCEAREEGRPCDRRCINAVSVNQVFDATISQTTWSG
jgi:ADP-heptose:LPS heptosyltransferase